ncbi:late control protein D [Escherichia coli]|nr:late control protein D [Escherichia coli]MBS8944210.1 late control protein D [Escherichia coli]HAW6015859.1 late control protein D [Escherichia coli]
MQYQRSWRHAANSRVDDAEWTITTLTHTVSPDNGFTTSLELEVRIDDFEMK